MAFQILYSKYYDLLYSDRNYERETSYMLDLIRKHSTLKVKSILDIACGTGPHAFNFAKVNMRVVASDMSEGMISLAQKKKVSEANPSYSVRDMRKLGKIGNFQTAVCLSSAFDYLTTYEDIESTFKGVRDNLETGGLFLFDIWNGIAVMHQKPTTRVKYINNPNVLLIRYSMSSIDLLPQIINIKFRLVIFEKGSTSPVVSEEDHKVRYFFPEEIRYLCKKNGFELIDIHPFENPRKKLTEEDWNMMVVAKKL